MTQLATAAQKQAMGALVSKLKIQDKDALVLGFSNMRTSSRADLTVAEARSLIKHLKDLDKEKGQKDAKCQKMRSYMIAMAYEMYGVPRSNATPAQKRNALDRLNEWCVDYGHCHKKLDDHEYDELIVLVTQYKKAHANLLSNL